MDNPAFNATAFADARRSFLTGLIDDAGLFPPASLGMDAAVDAHAAALTGPHRWMLSRFICPESRLAELEESLSRLPNLESWELSIILDPWDPSTQRSSHLRTWVERPAERLEAVAGFSRRVPAPIRFLEMRLPVTVSHSGTHILAAISTQTYLQGINEGGIRADNTIRCFLEVPPDDDETRVMATVMAGIARVGRKQEQSAPGFLTVGAKIRCGGPSADAIPSPSQVARFVHACRTRGVPFKATAGLHHPFRHVDPATGLVQHGFLNVVGAAVLAHAHGVDEGTLEDLIADDRPESFALTALGFRWLDFSADAAQIELARNELFISYGSCSFDEPVDDLVAMGVLPLEPV